MQFANPYCDDSPAELWPEEIVVLRRLMAGDALIQRRHYIGEISGHGISFYWDVHPEYPTQYDSPVSLLMSRGMIRTVRCAGGRTECVLTDAAKAAVLADSLLPTKGE